MSACAIPPQYGVVTKSSHKYTFNDPITRKSADPLSTQKLAEAGTENNVRFSSMYMGPTREPKGVVQSGVFIGRPFLNGNENMHLARTPVAKEDVRVFKPIIMPEPRVSMY